MDFPGSSGARSLSFQGCEQELQDRKLGASLALGQEGQWAQPSWAGPNRPLSNSRCPPGSKMATSASPTSRWSAAGSRETAKTVNEGDTQPTRSVGAEDWRFCLLAFCMSGAPVPSAPELQGQAGGWGCPGLSRALGP